MADLTGRLDHIDVGPWYDGDRAARRVIGIELVAALRRTGLVSITGHRIPGYARTRVFEAAARFFAAPEQVRLAVHHDSSDRYRGYAPVDDPGSPSRAVHFYDAGLEFADAYDGPGHRLRSSRNQWPQVPGFRAAVEAYLAQARQAADALLSMVALGLGWPTGFFTERTRKPVAQLRLLHYPRPAGSMAAPGVSIGSHTDYEALTLLAQDEAGGLEVRPPGGYWLPVPPAHDALVVSAGEMLTIWTNGALPAADHRVLIRRPTERYSVALFYGTDYDIMIEPRASAIGDGRPKYAPVATGDYLQHRFEEVGG